MRIKDDDKDDDDEDDDEYDYHNGVFDFRVIK